MTFYDSPNKMLLATGIASGKLVAGGGIGGRVSFSDISGPFHATIASESQLVSAAAVN
jgi:hypothetical protein